MKDSATPKRKSSILIVKNLIILLVIVIAAFVGSMSWFAQKSTAAASGVNVNCLAPEGVEIAVVDINKKVNDPKVLSYQETISLSDPELYLSDGSTQFLQNLSLTEITSDGITFYRPSLRQQDGIAYVVTGFDSQGNTVTWNKATPQSHYISFQLFFRAKNKQSIFLDNTSAITPNAPILTGLNVTNKSSYGDYSLDCIVGAARFSVVTNDNDHNRKLLWIPRPDIRLNTVNVMENDAVVGHNFTMSTHLPVGYDATYNHKYYAVDSTTNIPDVEPSYFYYKSSDDTTFDPTVNVTASKKISNKYMLGKNIEIATLSGSPASDGYYYNSVICNMWIEGEDDEAKLALVGGEFTMDLCFGAQGTVN